MLGCKTTIKIGNEEISFNSQQELDDFIYKNYNRLTSALKGNTVRFSKNEDPGEETYAKLLDYKTQASATISYEIDGTKYEVPKNEIIKKNGKSIGVTSFISQLKVDDRLIFTPFDKDNYITVITDRLTKENMDAGMIENEARNKAIDELDKIVKSWPLMSDLGTEIHTVASLFFDVPVPNFSTFRQLYAKQLNGGFHKISPLVLEQLYNKFVELRDHFKTYAGDSELKFLTEVPIYDEESGIIGIIDLLAVDTKGNTYIADFKTSFKLVDEQDRDKLKKYGYQLAFYKRLLEAKGINVMETTIVPIKLNTVEDDYSKITSIETEKLQNMGVILGNPSSEEFQFAKKNIKVDPSLSIKFETAEIIQTEQKDFFNLSSGEDLEIQYQHFLARELRKEGDKMYFWNKDNKRVYLKEIHVNPQTKEEQDENFMNKMRNEAVIKEFIQVNNSSKYKYTNDIKANLQRMMDTGDYYSPFKREGGNSAYDSDRERNAMNTFSHYANGTWSLLNIPELETEGVIAIKNDVSDYVDFIAVLDQDANQIIKLTKGTNILGEFKSDKQMLKENYAMPSTVRNHIGIKILSVLNNNVDLLKSQNLTINNIQTFNYYSMQQLPILKENLIENYKILSHETGRQFNLNDVKFTKAEDELLSAVMAALQKTSSDSGIDYRILNGINSILGSNFHSDAERVAELRKIKRQFEVDKNINFNNLDFNQDLDLVYGFLNSMITELSSNRVNFEESDMVQYGVSNSVFFSSFHELQSRVAKSALMPIRTAMDAMASNYLKHNNKFRPIFEEYYESKGVSTIKGDHQQSFSNLFERNDDGSIDKQFRFKNPEAFIGNNTYLDDVERKFLNKILPELGLRMYGEMGVANAKANGDYYNVPLKRAGQVSKVVEKGITGLAQQPKTLWSNMVNAAMEENFLFEEQRAEALDLADSMAEMYNKFNISKNPSARQQYIDSVENIEFEKNIELIFADVVFTDMKVKAYNNALPIVTATLVSSMMEQKKFGNYDLENTYDYIKKNIKSTVFDEKLIEEHQRGTLQAASSVKHAVSMLQLGIQPLNLVRETLQGQWATLSKLAAKQYGEDTPSFSDYKWALGKIAGEGIEFFTDVTMTEELNHMYRMANMDTNQLAEKMVISKTGMTQLTNRWWLWFMGAPDYLNRMGFLLAKMRKDGSYDAHRMENGVLVYDWTKDERFEIYAKGDKNDPKYEKQRGLYLAYLNQFNKENRQSGIMEDLVEGDALPKAYPTIERESIKSFVNYMHGPYDQEDKIMLNNTLFGVMFLQFRTWLIAKKQQYWMKGDEYSIGQFAQMVDPATGKPLFVTYNENGDGIMNTNGEGTPVYDWKGRYMEGVFNSFIRMWQEVTSGDGFTGVMDLLKNDNNIRSNMTMAGIELGVFVLMSLAIGAIPLDDIKEDSKLTEALIRMVGQSTQDLSIWSNVQSITNPESLFPTVSYVYKNIEDFFSMLTGSKDALRFVAGSSGFTRFLDQTTTVFETSE